MDNVNNKQFKVIISPKAAEMLIQHVRFLAQVSREAAEELRKDLIVAAKSLQKFPERNSWLSDPLLTERKYHKMVIDKRYLLIYQIKDGNAVYIDYILDCRQDYQWLL